MESVLELTREGDRVTLRNPCRMLRQREFSDEITS